MNNMVVMQVIDRKAPNPSILEILISEGSLFEVIMLKRL